MAWGYTSNVYATRNMLAGCVIGPEADPKPDYVFWLDDDNLISLDCFNRLMYDLETHPEVDVVSGWTWIQADAGGACTLQRGAWMRRASIVCRSSHPSSKPRPMRANCSMRVHGLSRGPDALFSARQGR